MDINMDGDVCKMMDRGDQPGFNLSNRRGLLGQPRISVFAGNEINFVPRSKTLRPPRVVETSS